MSSIIISVSFHHHATNVFHSHFHQQANIEFLFPEETNDYYYTDDRFVEHPWIRKISTLNRLDLPSNERWQRSAVLWRLQSRCDASGRESKQPRRRRRRIEYMSSIACFTWSRQRIISTRCSSHSNHRSIDADGRDLSENWWEIHDFFAETHLQVDRLFFKRIIVIWQFLIERTVATSSEKAIQKIRCWSEREESTVWSANKIFSSGQVKQDTRLILDQRRERERGQSTVNIKVQTIIGADWNNSWSFSCRWSSFNFFCSCLNVWFSNSIWAIRWLNLERHWSIERWAEGWNDSTLHRASYLLHK